MKRAEIDSVVDGLRSLSAEMKGSCEAPPHVEAALVEAFRRSRSARRRSRPRWAATVAASVLIAAAVALLHRKPPATAGVVPDRETEIVTEFLPVAGGDFTEPLERGRLVRVELPRSALAVFGLPMNEDRAWETVQADVVMGEDGMARAIRFVQASRPGKARQ